MQAVEILKNKLIGTFISGFSIGDVWDLDFGDYHVVAQEVTSDDENALGLLISEKFHWFRDTVDKEQISKCAIAAAAMRRIVNGVELNVVQDLVIEFEGNVRLRIPTDTRTVDWQWCLNRTGADPYTECIIACFDRDDIRISEHLN